MQAREQLVDLRSLKGLGIKPATAPLEKLCMPGVPRIGDRLEKIGVTPRAAHVLGRAGTPTGKTGRTDPTCGRQPVGDDDAMLPTVAEVITEFELVAGYHHIAQADRSSIDRCIGPVVGILDVRGVTDTE